MKKHLSFLLALLLLLVGCSTGNAHDPAVIEEQATTAPNATPTAAPTFTPEPTLEPTPEPTPTLEPLHLTREDVEKYRDCVVIPEGYSAPEYLAVTHTDGTISAGLMYDLFEAENWTDIVSISAGEDHVAGLRSDGTVVAVGSNSQGQLNVQDWTDIIALATGNDFTLGLRRDGTVAVAGNFIYADPDAPLAGALSSWTDIVAIDANGDLLIGLKKDGTIVYCSSSSYHMEDWTDIVSIVANSSIPMGVRKDGTVVTAVNETFRDYIEKNHYALLQEVKSWTDIEKVFFYYDWVFGLQSDGTVLVAGEDIAPQAKALRDLRDLANGWALQADGSLCYILDPSLYGSGTSGMEEVLRAKNIQQIAASSSFFFALLENGSVLMGGFSNDLVETVNNKWQNLKSISSGYMGRNMYGITRDGDLVAQYHYFGRIHNVASLHDGGAGTAIVFEDGTAFFHYSPYGYGSSLDGNDVYYNVSDWKNISQVVVGGDYLLGLTSDGSVVATGQNEKIINAVSAWKEVASLYTYGTCNDSKGTWEENIVLGLKGDGTVLACGDNAEIVSTVSQWRNVKKLYAQYGAVLAVTSENTVLTAGLYPYVAAEVNGWTDIADVAMHTSYVLGLKTDGTVISPREYDTDISQWQDIVQILMYYDSIAGLRANGTVVVAQEASSLSENTQKATETWENIVSLYFLNGDLWGLTKDGTAVSTGAYPPQNADLVQVVGDGSSVYGLRKDGTVAFFTDHNDTAKEWKDIARLIFTGFDAAWGNILLGIQTDGTVISVDTTLSNQELPQWKKTKEIVFYGSRYMGLMKGGTVAMGGGYELEVAKVGLSSWEEIIQIDCTDWDCIGLHEDGTVIVGGINEELKTAVAQWKDVVKVSLGSGCLALGLKKDGTVLIHEGYLLDPDCLEAVTDWADIVDIIATDTHAVGLKSDGTVVATGENQAGQCNVEDWENIVAIYATEGLTVGLTTEGTLRMTGNFDPGSNTILTLRNIGVPVVE